MPFWRTNKRHLSLTIATNVSRFVHSNELSISIYANWYYAYASNIKRHFFAFNVNYLLRKKIVIWGKNKKERKVKKKKQIKKL